MELHLLQPEGFGPASALLGPSSLDEPWARVRFAPRAPPVRAAVFGGTYPVGPRAPSLLLPLPMSLLYTPSVENTAAGPRPPLKT